SHGIGRTPTPRTATILPDNGRPFTRLARRASTRHGGPHQRSPSRNNRKDDSEPEATPNVNPRQAVTTSASGACTGSLLADTHGQTAHQVPLEQQIDDHRRKRADERSGHQERYVEQVLRRDR